MDGDNFISRNTAFTKLSTSQVCLKITFKSWVNQLKMKTCNNVKT